jgi:hypothetical protein
MFYVRIVLDEYINDASFYGGLDFMGFYGDEYINGLFERSDRIIRLWPSLHEALTKILKAEKCPLLIKNIYEGNAFKHVNVNPVDRDSRLAFII